MGEWMIIPGAEEMIAERINRYCIPSKTLRRRYHRIPVDLDLCVNFTSNDLANLADVVEESPLLDFEIPLTDDGF